MKTIIIILSLTLSSCSLLVSRQLKKEMNPFIGKPQEDLVMRYGTPVRTENDGRTGTIWVYAKHYYQAPYDVAYTGGVNHVPSKEFWHYKFFYVNVKGIVYHWRWSNESVPPQRIYMNIYQRISFN